MFLSAVWTLILTAPIHCRGSIDEQVMECYISPNLMKKQTHLHLGWPEGRTFSANVHFWLNYLKLRDAGSFFISWMVPITHVPQAWIQSRNSIQGFFKGNERTTCAMSLMIHCCASVRRLCDRFDWQGRVTAHFSARRTSHTPLWLMMSIYIRTSAQFDKTTHTLYSPSATVIDAMLLIFICLSDGGVFKQVM